MYAYDCINAELFGKCGVGVKMGFCFDLKAI